MRRLRLGAVMLWVSGNIETKLGPLRVLKWRMALDKRLEKKNYQNISNVIGLDLNDNFQAEQHGTVTEALTNKNLFLTPGHSLIWPKRACAP